MRTVWVSFDTIGRDCLIAAAESGREVVGVVTLPAPVDPNRSGQCSFDDVAAGLGAEVVETTDVNSEATLDAVRRLDPELIFVVGWSQLVRDPFIALAREGIFGLHPTLLPRHRGRAPIPWAILSGLARTGVTLFEIVDATADSGSIVGQVAVEIAPDETASTLFDRLATAHVELVREYVPQLVAGTAPRIPQDPKRASHWQNEVPGRRDHRLGDARAVSLRLGAGADEAVSRRVHVPRRREGRRLARTTRGARRGRAGRDDRRRRRRGTGRRLWRGRARPRGDRDRGCSARSGSEARMTRVLVFAAHPDDEVLGMGGTIAVHAAARADAVRIVCVTDGSSTQYPGDAAKRAQKEGEARRAAHELGVDDYVHLDLPDMRLDTLAHVEVNRVVEEQISDFAPEVVYTPQPDVNLDHRALFDSVAVATRPVPGQRVRRLLTYAPTSSIEWTPAPVNWFVPNWFVDITATLERKLAAFAYYETEMRPYPHPRSERAIRAAAEFHGASCGCEYAEPFVLVRALEPI